MPTLSLFDAHRAPRPLPEQPRGITSRLQSQGLATIEGLTTRTAVLALAQRVMRLEPHRDSDSDELTTIQDIGRRSQQSGLGGLGNGELLPHTERSSEPHPPRLMLLVCLRPATTGGEVILTDGQAVHGYLAERSPAALEALTLPNTVFYGDGGGHPSQVFTRHPGQRTSIRLRQDSLAAFSPLISGYLPQLRQAINAVQQRLTLEAGQGYLIDNYRWLHARTAFTGNRVCLRALGTPRFPMPIGFPQVAPSQVHTPAAVGGGTP
ncbi:MULTISPECIES: TauD/TfdA family dioxygenase [unclassified Streptomyces]|uniref:TauD/TfdA family dioxygenase n=1 Tax=unclassified Streptomyces TaxID=2593676 RepID=UPI0013A6F476|nr:MULTISPECIES: TauD/TfdA family dioxygenase [unclassified Streptomyces]